MKTENVKQIIQELFRANYNLYPESYPIHKDVSDGPEPRALETVTDVAHGYFDNRTEDEIARDQSLNISESNYVEWCLLEFHTILEEEEK